MKLKYVNREHDHRLYNLTGECLIRGRGPGPRNQLVRMDDTGELIIAPWGNWRKATEKQGE